MIQIYILPYPFPPFRASEGDTGTALHAGVHTPRGTPIRRSTALRGPQQEGGERPEVGGHPQPRGVGVGGQAFRLVAEDLEAEEAQPRLLCHRHRRAICGGEGTLWAIVGSFVVTQLWPVWAPDSNLPHRMGA